MSISTIERTVLLQDGEMVKINNLQPFTIVRVDSPNFKFITDWINASYDFHRSLFLVFTDLLSTHSVDYAHSVLNSFKYWLAKDDSIKSELDINHLNSIPKPYFDFIIPTLRKIVSRNLPGINEKLREYLLQTVKFETSKKGLYFVLVTNDPERGALTNQELSSIHNGLNESYANGKISITEFTIAWFFIATGLRPKQISKVCIEDLLIIDGAEKKEINLRITLAKGIANATETYWIRRAPTILAECLLIYLQTISWSHDSSEQLFKLKPDQLRSILKKTIDKCDTWSARLEGPIPVSPYRFRYTLATRALREGASDEVVARLLTHRSLTCIRFYRASMPELQRPIKEKIGPEMEFFAKAFRGKIIKTLEDATHPESPILDYLRLTGETLGACGTMAKCYQDAPIACLSCPYFEPLEDAPWQKLLEILIKESNEEHDNRIRQIFVDAIQALHEIISKKGRKNGRA